MRRRREVAWRTASRLMRRACCEQGTKEEHVALHPVSAHARDCDAAGCVQTHGGRGDRAEVCSVSAMRQMVNAARHIGQGLFLALAEIGQARMSPVRSPRQAAERLSRGLAAMARAHDLEVSVRGELPRGPALIVANHVSYLDPIAILSQCPAIPLAKGDVADWPIIGGASRGLGVMLVRREEPMQRVR